jgi:hypothetical protein
MSGAGLAEAGSMMIARTGRKIQGVIKVYESLLLHAFILELPC